MVHPPAQGGVRQSRSLRTMSSWVLNVSKDGDSASSLGNLCQYLISLTVKKFFLSFRWSFQEFPGALCPITQVINKDVK